MENLIQLVKSLKKSEISFIQHYYKNDTDKKRLKLFNWVLDGKVKTDDEAANKLYGGKGPAYSHLKSRLLNDLMNLLLFEEGSRQSESEKFQNETDALRHILQGKILFNRKVHNLAIKQWEKSLEISDKFELLPEKVIVKDLMSESVGVRKGIEEYEKIIKDIDEDIRTIGDLMLAKKLYFGVALPNVFLKNNESEFARLANLSMNKLQKIYDLNLSPSIGYFYFLTAISYYNIIRDFEKLYEISTQFLHLIEKEQSIRSKARLTNAYLQLYGSAMYLGLFEEALQSAERALEFTNKGGPNEISVLEYIFMAKIQLKAPLNLNETLISGTNHPRLKYSKYIESKWSFYKAIYLYKTRNFDKCIQELQKESELLKDKSGWLFGLKLLEILCYIELEEFDMIDYRIESLRKLLQRQKHKNIVRIKSIFNVLNTLVKTGYSFKNTYKKEAEIFQLLSESKDEYFWDPLGYELIRFDEWFRSKI